MITLLKEGKIYQHMESGNLIRIVEINAEPTVVVENVAIKQGQIQVTSKQRTIKQREISKHYKPFVRDRSDELCLWRSAKSNQPVRVKQPMGDRVLVENVVVTDYEILPVPNTERAILASSLYRHYN